MITRRSDTGSQLSLSLIIWRNTGKVTFGDVGPTAGLEFGASGPRMVSGSRIYPVSTTLEMWCYTQTSITVDCMVQIAYIGHA